MTGTRMMGQGGASLRVRGWDGSSLDDSNLAGADPLGFAAGDANLYRYVGNSPTNATDPTGLFEQPSPGYTYPDYKPIPTPAQANLKNNQDLYNGYVGAVKSDLINMIQKYPRTGFGPNACRLDPDNLPQGVKDEAAEIAKLYVDAVQDFLKTHPNATPGYWTIAILRNDRSPDCDNWATSVNQALSSKQWKYFNVRWGTYKNPWTGYQHQMNIVTPQPYDCTGFTTGRMPDGVPVILDPWPTNTPATYPIENNWTGHMPQQVW